VLPEGVKYDAAASLVHPMVIGIGLTMGLICELLVACKAASQTGLRAKAAHSLVLSHLNCCHEEGVRKATPEKRQLIDQASQAPELCGSNLKSVPAKFQLALYENKATSFSVTGGRFSTWATNVEDKSTEATPQRSTGCDGSLSISFTTSIEEQALLVLSGRSMLGVKAVNARAVRSTHTSQELEVLQGRCSQ